MALRATGPQPHRTGDKALAGYAFDGLGAAVAGECEPGRDERGRPPPALGGSYCPTCLRRVPAGAVERRFFREVCASGTLDVWLLHCPACDTALKAEVVVPAND